MYALPPCLQVTSTTFHSLQGHPELQELHLGPAVGPLDPRWWGWISTAPNLKKVVIKTPDHILSSDPLLALLSLQAVQVLVLQQYKGLNDAVLGRVAQLLRGVEHLSLEGCEVRGWWGSRVLGFGWRIGVFEF